MEMESAVRPRHASVSNSGSAKKRALGFEMEMVSRDDERGDFDPPDDHDRSMRPPPSSGPPPSPSIDYTSNHGENDLVEDGDSSDDGGKGYDGDDGQDDEHPTIPLARLRHPAYTPGLFVARPHLAVLPVLLLEFLALALTRAVLPSLLLERYGSRTYIVMGAAECVRGVLAFFACPLFGKLSDVWGRRPCLLITVVGTLAPVCSLAFWKTDDVVMEGEDTQTMAAVGAPTGSNIDEKALFDGVDAGDPSQGSWYPMFGSERMGFSMGYSPSIHRIDAFVALLALSGMFSSTFTLTFAYISDVVKDRAARVAAYGLALATFGLSFTIGPLLGGYLANVEEEGKGRGVRGWADMFHAGDEDGSNTHHESKRIFSISLVLGLLDLLYIHFILPESLNSRRDHLECTSSLIDVSLDGVTEDENPNSTAMTAASSTSNVPHPAGLGVSRRASSSWWNPFDAIRYLTTDPLLSTIGRVTFLYYTALHAVVSTLILYAERQFHLGPQRLGELMAALGLSTMVSEAVLVRVAVPLLGEPRCMRIGLTSFALQCVLLAVADSPWHLFACAFLAMVGNLVYPSISSLVSGSVRPEMIGRALGAINGVKSLTEGVGPLIFGTLLTMSEKDKFPGWPYFLAAIMVCLAYRTSERIKDDSEYHHTMSNMETRFKEEEHFGLLDITGGQGKIER